MAKPPKEQIEDLAVGDLWVLFFKIGSVVAVPFLEIDRTC